MIVEERFKVDVEEPKLVEDLKYRSFPVGEGEGGRGR